MCEHTLNTRRSFKVSSVLNSRCPFHGASDTREWDLATFHSVFYTVVPLLVIAEQFLVYGREAKCWFVTSAGIFLTAPNMILQSNEKKRVNCWTFGETNTAMDLQCDGTHWDLISSSDEPLRHPPSHQSLWRSDFNTPAAWLGKPSNEEPDVSVCMRLMAVKSLSLPV